MGILFFLSQVDFNSVSLTRLSMNSITMSISDEVAFCTGQTEMLNRLLKSDLIGSRCCGWLTTSGVINSSTATNNACPLMVTVIQAENFKQMNSSKGGSKYTSIYSTCVHSNVYSFGKELLHSSIFGAIQKNKDVILLLDILVNRRSIPLSCL